MEDLKTRVEELTGNVSDYAETMYKLTTIKVVEKASTMASTVVNSVVILFLALLVILFGAFALAWWLGDMIENRAAGFILTSGFFLLLLVVLYALRKKIIYPIIRNRIIKSAYD